MLTPFDQVIEHIRLQGYHNHRMQDHSDIVCEGIYKDLLANCPSLMKDADEGRIKHWLNVKTPGARNRKIDLLIGEPNSYGKPDLDKTRICIENKSVTTAHRNKDARYDDLNETMQVIQIEKPKVIMAATVLVGVAERVLNVPDKIKPFYQDNSDFRNKIVPRLSTGDQTLWTEFRWAVSKNRPDEPLKTIAKFKSLPMRSTETFSKIGYDYILFIPVNIDNVNPPSIDRSLKYGIDIDAEYGAMIDIICKKYNLLGRQ